MTDAPRHRVHVVPGLRRPGGILFHDWLAITLGRHVWAWRDLGPPELAHELEHVRQWRRHGFLFPAVYALASLRAVRARRHWYRDNAFELAARRAGDAAGGKTRAA
jgi:hypothetical protein